MLWGSWWRATAAACSKIYNRLVVSRLSLLTYAWCRSKLKKKNKKHLNRTGSSWTNQLAWDMWYDHRWSTTFESSENTCMLVNVIKKENNNILIREVEGSSACRRKKYKTESEEGDYATWRPMVPVLPMMHYPSLWSLTSVSTCRRGSVPFE